MEPIVNVPIGDYDALRDRVRELEAENAQLKECNEHLCEEGKVFVIREKIEVVFSGTAVDSSIRRKKLIELKNVDEVKDEVVEALTKKVELLEEANKSLIENTESQFETNRAICKKAQELEAEVERLKNRGWWERLRNK